LYDHPDVVDQPVYQGLPCLSCQRTLPNQSIEKAPAIVRTRPHTGSCKQLIGLCGARSYTLSLAPVYISLTVAYNSRSTRDKRNTIMPEVDVRVILNKKKKKTSRVQTPMQSASIERQEVIIFGGNVQKIKRNHGGSSATSVAPGTRRGSGSRAIHICIRDRWTTG